MPLFDVNIFGQPIIKQFYYNGKCTDFDPVE